MVPQSLYNSLRLRGRQNIVIFDLYQRFVSIFDALESLLSVRT